MNFSRPGPYCAEHLVSTQQDRQRSDQRREAGTCDNGAAAMRLPATTFANKIVYARSPRLWPCSTLARPTARIFVRGVMRQDQVQDPMHVHMLSQF
eukprot:2495165-Rhodomonas_salina.3